MITTNYFCLIIAMRVVVWWLWTGRQKVHLCCVAIVVVRLMRLCGNVVVWQCGCVAIVVVRVYCIAIVVARLMWSCG